MMLHVLKRKGLNECVPVVALVHLSEILSLVAGTIPCDRRRVRSGQLRTCLAMGAHLSDGQHNLFEVAGRSLLPFQTVRRPAEALLAHRLLKDSTLENSDGTRTMISELSVRDTQREDPVPTIARGRTGSRSAQ